MKKPFIQGGLIFLITLFVISPVFRWIGLPTFYDLLVVLFGEPKFWNKIFAALFSIVLICGTIKLSNKIFVKD